MGSYAELTSRTEGFYPDRASSPGEALSALSTVWFFAIELFLLYTAFRIGYLLGAGRSEGTKKESAKTMNDLSESPSEPVRTPEGAAEASAKTAEGPAEAEAEKTAPAEAGKAAEESAEPTEAAKAAEESAEPTEVAKAAEEPAPTEAGKAAQTPEDSEKVAWDDFIKSFESRDRDSHGAFPDLEPAPDISDDEVGALLADERLGIRDLLAACRDRSRRREIALAFLDRFPEPASEWTGASLLMTADEDATYWVAGDIHAKVSAIAKVCAVVADRRDRGLTKRRNVLVLLGDYVDRGDEPLETLAFIESLKLRPLFDGFEVVALKGNHDVGLSRNENGEYASMVSPAETAEFLRARTREGDDVSVEAEAAMRLAAVSPRMCELTGADPVERNRTILFVHGGVPHVDLQKGLWAVRNHVPQGDSFFEAHAGDAIPEELRRGCAEDFTWIRFARDVPWKLPNRGSRGCEIGTEDVSQYLFLHRALTSRDITFIFRGYDHERAGFACYSPHPTLNPTKKRYAQRECAVLTLNTMEPDLSSAGMFRERDLALAEWTLGGPVRLHRILTRHLEATGEPMQDSPAPPPDQAAGEETKTMDER